MSPIAYHLAAVAVMAGVTYLIRALPFAFFRGPINSRFLRSFLYYIPYAVLTAMTIPAVFTSAGSPLSAAAGFAVALVLAYMRLPLIAVASAEAAAAFLVSFLG